MMIRISIAPSFSSYREHGETGERNPISSSRSYSLPLIVIPIIVAMFALPQSSS
jgi:hypothetical protein